MAVFLRNRKIPLAVRENRRMEMEHKGRMTLHLETGGKVRLAMEVRKVRRIKMGS